MRYRLPVCVRPVFLVTGMIVPVLLFGAFSLAQDNTAGKPPAARQKKSATARQQFKNIKVLKELPADQLIPVMHKINLSLGVKCDFCHVVQTSASGQHTGFERDEKPMKQVARQMIVMTHDINTRQKIVDGKVTCYTCHHGHAAPENTPPAR